MSEFSKNRSNHSARLAAVQALYQIELTERSAEAVTSEFLEHRLKMAPHQEKELKVNLVLFEEIVKTTSERMDQVNDLIRQSLPKNWSLERLDAVLRAILRAGF